jgi:hypothetical protein
VQNLKTYDFSTLYTAIPHDKLKTRMSELIIKSFNSNNWDFITVGKYKASWSKKIKPSLCFTCDEVIKLINWLIDNTYVTVGNQVFKQCIGIPMGTDCAPYLANLFLFSYEFEFMNNLLKEKKWLILRKFSKCFRYIDDLLGINNDNFLEKWKTKIYPKELLLTSDDRTDKEVNFLDLHLEVKNYSFSYRLFDKRDHFPFQIINYPCLSGNISTHQSYNVFTAQLIRYARCCQQTIDFHHRVKLIVSKLLQQHFKLSQLQKTYNKFLFKHTTLFIKYGTMMKKKLTDIIQDGTK